MPPPKTENEQDVIEGRTAFAYCPYKRFLDPNDLTKSSQGANPYMATCGFNQDPLFYCPPHQGDTPVTTLQNKFFSFLATIDEQRLCHFNTNGFD